MQESKTIKTVITINGKKIPMNPFVQEIIANVNLSLINSLKKIPEFSDDQSTIHIEITQS